VWVAINEEQLTTLDLTPHPFQHRNLTELKRETDQPHGICDPMINLDDISIYEKLDPSGLHLRLSALPDQCRQAWLEATNTVLAEGLGQCTEVIVAGMGGSAIAGDLAADLSGPASAVPIRVVRDFRIPGLAVSLGSQPKQLVVVCSFSGETEETLSMLDQAQAADARIIAITGGGALARRASEANIPTLAINAPGEPRSAVGYHLLLLASLLDRAGVITVSDQEVEEAVAAAEAMVSNVGIQVPTADNQAKMLAAELVGRLTLVYGSGPLSGMALRWKSQINENGKSWAFAESLPELLHNSVESFPGGLEISSRTTALLLKPFQATSVLERRYSVLVETLERFGIQSRLLTGISGSALAQSLAMIVLGDHVSYYMGLLNGFNPSETPSIDLFKDRLSASDAG